MVILDAVYGVGKAERRRELHLVFGLVLAVAAAPLRLDEGGRRERHVPRDLGDVVEDTVFIFVVGGFKLAGADLVAQREGDARVDDGLPLHRLLIILKWDVDIRKHGQIRLPVEVGARFFVFALLFVEFADDFAFFKVELVFKAVAVDARVEILARVLRGAGAETVEAEGVFVVFALVVLVFAARVELAEDELPVEAFFVFVPVHRAAAAEILDLDGLVKIAREGYNVAMPLACLVDGVREDLKDRVLAALKPVRPENDRRALADAVRSLELRDAGVSVFRRGFFHRPSAFLH